MLGVDIGGVLRPHRQGWTESRLQVPPMPGALEALALLGHRRFGERMHIVSRVDPGDEDRSRRWLEWAGIPEFTGIPLERVHFCHLRSEKAALAQRLGITHFVDDRLEVLVHMETVPHRHLFRPDPAEVAAFTLLLAGVPVHSRWDELAQALMRD